MSSPTVTSLYQVILGGVFSVICLLFGLIVNGQNKKIDKQNKEVEKTKNECLSESKHDLLCNIAKLKINEHVTKEIDDFKKEIYPILHKIEKKLDKLNGQD